MLVLKYLCNIWQRHLLPFQMGQGDHGPDSQLLPGRPRPHYTYSRKSLFKRNRGSQYGLDFTDNDEDDCNLKPVSCQFLYFNVKD